MYASMHVARMYVRIYVRVYVCTIVHVYMYLLNAYQMRTYTNTSRTYDSSELKIKLSLVLYPIKRSRIVATCFDKP